VFDVTLTEAVAPVTEAAHDDPDNTSVGAGAAFPG